MRKITAHGVAMAAATAVSAALSGCANQTVFHTTPVGAKVYINGELCGDSPCTHHSRYGFPDRMRVQLEKDGYEPSEFFLDTEPPLLSYTLYLFGAYLFHTYPEEYRFKMRPRGGTGAATAPPPAAPYIPPPTAAPPPAASSTASPPIQSI